MKQDDMPVNQNKTRLDDVIAYINHIYKTPLCPEQANLLARASDELKNIAITSFNGDEVKRVMAQCGKIMGYRLESNDEFGQKEIVAAQVRNIKNLTDIVKMHPYLADEMMHMVETEFQRRKERQNPPLKVAEQREFAQMFAAVAHVRQDMGLWTMKLLNTMVKNNGIEAMESIAPAAVDILQEHKNGHLIETAPQEKMMEMFEYAVTHGEKNAAVSDAVSSAMQRATDIEPKLALDGCKLAVKVLEQVGADNVNSSAAYDIIGAMVKEKPEFAQFAVVTIDKALPAVHHSAAADSAYGVLLAAVQQQSALSEKVLSSLQKAPLQTQEANKLLRHIITERPDLARQALRSAKKPDYLLLDTFVHVDYEYHHRTSAEGRQAIAKMEPFLTATYNDVVGEYVDFSENYERSKSLGKDVPEYIPEFVEMYVKSYNKFHTENDAMRSEIYDQSREFMQYTASHVADGNTANAIMNGVVLALEKMEDGKPDRLTALRQEFLSSQNVENVVSKDIYPHTTENVAEPEDAKVIASETAFNNVTDEDFADDGENVGVVTTTTDEKDFVADDDDDFADDGENFADDDDDFADDDENFADDDDDFADDDYADDVRNVVSGLEGVENVLHTSAQQSSTGHTPEPQISHVRQFKDRTPDEPQISHVRQFKDRTPDEPRISHVRTVGAEKEAAHKAQNTLARLRRRAAREIDNRLGTSLENVELAPRLKKAEEWAVGMLKRRNR